MKTTIGGFFKVGFLVGYFTGFLTGIIDSTLSWKLTSLFLSSPFDKASYIIFTGLLYGIWGSLLLSLITSLLYLFIYYTLPGTIILYIKKSFSLNQPLKSHVVAFTYLFIPTISVALFFSFHYGYLTITYRHHKALIVIAIIGFTLLYTSLAFIILGFISPLVSPIFNLVERSRFTRWITSSYALLIVPIFEIGLGLSYIIYKYRETVFQLNIRPFFVGTGWLFLVIVICLIGNKFRSLPFINSILQKYPMVILYLLTIIVTVLLGNGEERKKAVVNFTGFGSYLIKTTQLLFDLDQDGYSFIFGGGDCNEFNPLIHPEAPEIPENGIDENCTGGDVKLTSTPQDIEFVENFPKTIPKDLNIILITIDALRRDHLSIYGYSRKTSPNIDRVAREGTLFLNSWSHAPSTRYEIPSILTGRYPSHIIWDYSVWWPGIKEQNKTISEYLKELGYTTGAILNYSYFDRIRKIDQGFDFYDNSNARLHVGLDPASTRGSSSKEQAEKAFSYLETNKDKKFFLWIHFYDPHYYYEYHKGFLQFGSRKVDLYDHEILYTDFYIGEVLNKLKKLNLYDKSVVIITGDHGECFGERGINLHGYHLYACQTAIPIIIKVPGVKPSMVRTPVGHIDLLPTIVNIAGGKVDQTMYGKSLLGEILGIKERNRDRVIFQEVSYEGPTKKVAVVNSHWHLIYNMLPDNTYELYRIDKDPLENKDLWKEFKRNREVIELKEKLSNWVDSLNYPPETRNLMEAALLKEKPKPMIQLDINFNNELLLLGMDIDKKVVRSGEEFKIAWYFKALKRINKNWKIFVHIEGPQRFLGDHYPVEGLFPFNLWTKGIYVKDEQVLRVPDGYPKGIYSIYVGLFIKEKRLKVISTKGLYTAEDRVKVIELQVR